MIPAFRLCKTKHLATTFGGDGARINGGRWNSPGLAAVYTSSSLSLATLEVLVHLEDPEAFARLFSWVPLQIPEEIVERLDISRLPAAWRDNEANLASRSAGDAWLRSRRTAVLAVPSVVTPGEWNYMLNPLHPGISSVTMGEPKCFRPDPRLMP